LPSIDRSHSLISIPQRFFSRLEASMRWIGTLPKAATFLLAGSGLLWSACSAPAEDSATLVLRGGKVVTVDEAVPDGEAIAVSGDRILLVGSDADVEAFIGPATEVIDLQGQLAIPGLIESHAHFMGIGQAQLQLNLMDVAIWDDVIEMVAAAVAEAEPGTLIQGRGWHQEKWDRVPSSNVDGLPLHHSLSAVSPDNPVVLGHASGHAVFANAKAMEMAGIDRNTQPPSGGEIVVDAQGDPIGVFRETAAGLLGPAYEGAGAADPRRVAQLADEEVLSKGITTLHDAGVGFETVDLYKEMVEAGELGVRLHVMLSASNEDLRARIDEYRLIGYGDDHLTVRSIKRLIDGALGPHGAWLLEPYEDLPSSTGLNTTSVEIIEETARIAAEHDFQLNVHAIGDRANRETLDIFQRTFEAFPEKSDFRWRDEHTQHLHPDDIARFGELGVIAAMQGIHCTSDAPYVLERLGRERAEEGAYVWQKLMQTGAVISNGTDAPVEDVDPIPSYYATVSRKLKDGTVFFPDQRMSRMEALESYTINGAFAGFEEDVKGSLTPGKLADITVLSKDILTIPEDEIPTAEVVYTIVGGEVKFAKNGRAGEN
jgi:predicted amidohydrolase YtcJ